MRKCLSVLVVLVSAQLVQGADKEQPPAFDWQEWHDTAAPDRVALVKSLKGRTFVLDATWANVTSSSAYFIVDTKHSFTDKKTGKAVVEGLDVKLYIPGKTPPRQFKIPSGKVLHVEGTFKPLFYDQGKLYIEPAITKQEFVNHP